MPLSNLVATFRKLVLTAAALASGAAAVACCDGYQKGGVLDIAIAGDGRAITDNPPSVSSDGGLTWSWGEYSPTDGGGSAQSVETPRGTYFIHGAKVYLSANGTAREVYSAAHLSQSANRWALARDLSQCESVLTTRPNDIAYDDASGNVIVAMGQLGVAVGLPGGEWREVAVGGNYPRDFSFAGKLKLLTETGFWIGALAAAFAVGGVAVALYALSGEGSGRSALVGIGYILAMPIIVAIVLFINLAGLIYAARMWILAIIAIGGALFIIDRHRKGHPPLRTLAAALRALRDKASGGRILAAVSTAAVLAIACYALALYDDLLFILSGALAIVILPMLAMTRMNESLLRRGVALGCSVLGAVLGAASLLPYSSQNPGDGDAYVAWVFGAFGVLFSAGGLALAALAVRRLAASASAIALSYALLIAAFALWIANITPAAVIFLIAPAAVAVGLWIFLHADSERRREDAVADS